MVKSIKKIRRAFSVEGCLKHIVGVARWSKHSLRFVFLVARLFSPLIGYAEWLEPYGQLASELLKIHHSFSLRSNIVGFCRTDFAVRSCVT